MSRREWQCIHSVGHPNEDVQGVDAIHDCDGCCAWLATKRIYADLVTAHDSLKRAEDRFADLCDKEIMSNHEGREHLTEQKTAFEGGSTRSAKLERYDLIPPEIDRALALRFGLGAIKHGDDNWKSGGVGFIRSCLNHLRGHYVSLLTNGPDHDDDDVGAMIWNAGVLAWFRKHKPAEFREALSFQDAKGVTKAEG